MIEINAPSLTTVITIVVFLIFYLCFLFRKAIQNAVDIYDVFLLSLVAVIPALFALMPRTSYRFSLLMGVAFPFVILFGALFVVVFIFLFRLLLTLNRQTRTITTLVQELGLLRGEVEEKHSNTTAATLNVIEIQEKAIG